LFELGGNFGLGVELVQRKLLLSQVLQILFQVVQPEPCLRLQMLLFGCGPQTFYLRQDHCCSFFVLSSCWFSSLDGVVYEIGVVLRKHVVTTLVLDWRLLRWKRWFH
jgi:hypothetical protein